MKPIFFIIFVFLLSSCTHKKKETSINEAGIFYPEVQKRTIIKGTITNIIDFEDESKTIRLLVDDIPLDEQIKYITNIDENGHFLFNIPLNNPTNVYLKYLDGKIEPYIVPNDTLVIQCKISTVGSKIDINAISYDKKHNDFQIKFRKHNRWFTKQIRHFIKNRPNPLSTEHFKNYCFDFIASTTTKINERIEDKESDSIIYKYLKYSTIYYSYKDIVRSGKDLKDPKEKELFFSFLTDSIIFNNNALITSSYRNFLNNYSQLVEDQIPTTVNTFGDSDDQIKKKLVSQTTKNLTNLRTGFWTDYLLASYINSSILHKEEEISASSMPYYVELIKTNIHDNYTREFLLSKMKEMQSSINERNKIEIAPNSKLQDHALSPSNLYSKILKENKGKVIYLDFWGTWCAPCIQQMPYSNRLHAKLAHKNVAFVYLACKSNTGAAENIIKKEQLNGQNYILNQEDYEYFEKLFKINGLPRYVLIDKYGKIYSKNATRPQSEKTLEIINQLLQ